MNIKSKTLSILAGISLAGCVQVGQSPGTESSDKRFVAKEIFEQFQKSGYKEEVIIAKKQELLKHGYICDAANILSEKQELSLEKMMDSLKITTGAQGYLITFPGIQIPNLFGTYALKGLDIGLEGINNGFLITLDPSKKELHTWTGYGVEGSLPDGLIHQYIHNGIDSLIREGNHAQAIKDILLDIQKSIAPEDITKFREKISEAEGEVLIRNIIIGIIGTMIGLLILYGLLRIGGADGAAEFVELLIKLPFIVIISASGDGGGGGS